MESAGDTVRRPLTRWVVGLVVTAIYLPPVLSVGLRTDTGGHLLFAESMAQTGREFGPYNLFEQLVIVVRAFIPFGALERIDPVLGDRATIWDISGVLVVMASVLITADLVHARLSDGKAIGLRRRPWAVVASSVVAMVVAPITVLTWSGRHLLTGYVNITSYENPTANLVRPFALALLSLFASRVHTRNRRQVVALAALLSVLALMAKPSFTICFLPAVVILWALFERRGEAVDRRFLALGFVLPSVAVLLFQLAMAQGEGGVGLDPLATVRELLASRGHSLWMFPVFVLLSALFPIIVLVVQRREVVRSLPLVTAWLTFAVGIASFSLMRITGRTDYGDLVWGPQVALLLLMVESIRLWAGRRGISPTGFWIAAVALALHVVSGGVLWWAEVYRPAAWW